MIFITPTNHSVVEVIASGNSADLTVIITPVPMRIFELLAFCLPTIIGALLLIKVKNK